MYTIFPIKNEADNNHIILLCEFCTQFYTLVWRHTIIEIYILKKKGQLEPRCRASLGLQLKFNKLLIL